MLQRRLEPGKGGDQAILAAYQFAAQRQRFDIGRIEIDRAAGGIDRAGDVAAIVANAAEIGPGGAVIGG